jgi:TPR repeat protein
MNPMADLSGLNLLRNDPDLAARLIAEAEAGDMDAQYAAGLVYAEGRGVEPDLVQAYFWLTRAVQQGDGDAEKLRRYVASQMSGTEFADAKRLVRLAGQAAMQADFSPQGGRRH